MRFSSLATGSTRPGVMCLARNSTSALRSGNECHLSMCCRNSSLAPQPRYARAPSIIQGTPRHSSATHVPAPGSYAKAAIRCLRTVAHCSKSSQLHSLRNGCAANNRLQPPVWSQSRLRTAMVCSTAAPPRTGGRRSRLSDSRDSSVIGARRNLHQCQLLFVSARAAAVLPRDRTAHVSVAASRGSADGPVASNLREKIYETPHGSRGHQDEEPSNSAEKTIVHDAGSKRLEMLRQSVVQDLQAVQEQEKQRAESRTLRVRLATSLRVAFQTYYTVNLLAVAFTAHIRLISNMPIGFIPASSIDKMRVHHGCIVNTTSAVPCNFQTKASSCAKTCALAVCFTPLCSLHIQLLNTVLLPLLRLGRVSSRRRPSVSRRGAPEPGHGDNCWKFV